jgi:SPP1 gp7 family putative phage head morphogenesis protein
MKPERVPDISATVSLRIIRQGVLLEQYKTQEVRQLISFLNRFIEPDLEAKLRQYAGKTLSTARVQAMRDAVKSILQDGYRQMKNDLLDDLGAQAKVEAPADTAVIADALPFDVSLVTPSAAVLRTMLATQPINGAFVPEWFGALAANVVQRTNQQIMIGATTGESIDDIVRRIVGTRANRYRDGILERSRSDVEAVARTAVAGVSNNVRQEVYDANTDLIKGVQITATLDTRTCIACMDQDGQVYDVDSGPRPPLHFNCRCTTVPILRSWQELGLPLQEAKATTRASNALTRAMAKQVQGMDPEQRRAVKMQFQGQVPASLTYPQWLSQQTAEVQDEALGRTRGQLFRSEQLKIRDFIGTSNRVLTLEELQDQL